MKRIIGLLVIGLLVCGQAYAQTNTFVKSKGDFVKSTAVTWTPSITGKCEIQSVTVHFDPATDEDIGVFLDSELGATYDTVLATSDSVYLNDFFWQPEDTFILEKDDNLRIRIEGGSGSEPYTITIRGDYK